MRVEVFYGGKKHGVFNVEVRIFLGKILLHL